MKKYMGVALALVVLGALLTLSVTCTLGCNDESESSQNPPARTVEDPVATFPQVSPGSTEPAPVVTETAPQPAPSQEPAPAPEPQPEPQPVPPPPPVPTPSTAPCPT